MLTITLSACAPGAATQPPAGPATPVPLPTDTTVPGATQQGLTYQLDPAVASSATVDVVAAVAAKAGDPYWLPAPEFRQMTLAGYPVAQHEYKPQVFVYPVEDFKAANAEAAKVIAALQGMLQGVQPKGELPFLPLYNARQGIRFGVQNLDFQNGKGIRYLTQYDQAPIVINNFELIYTYQGLTNDGKYYVAAVLPVKHPSLPNEAKVTEEDPSQFPAYITEMSSQLNAQPAGSFTPDLARLDALMSSFKVQ